MINGLSRDNPFSFGACYSEAWKAFSGWWLPLCLLSGILVVGRIIPKLIMMSKSSELFATVMSFLTAFSSGNADKMLHANREMMILLMEVMRKVLVGACLFLPVAALIGTLLLLYANRAVKNEKDKRPTRQILSTAFWRVVMSFFKIIGFLFFILPGVVLYIRLLFVPFYMLEYKRSFLDSMKLSWKQTGPYFWELTAVIITNALIQSAAGLTVVGLIPVCGFTNTVRATAFRQTLPEEFRGDPV